MNQVAIPDPLLGCEVRGYRIERMIAAGGMGAVYLARDTTLPNLVKVVKVLLPDMLLQPRQRAVMFDRFAKEGIANSVLRHDAIVAIHAAGQLDNGIPYILMDYVEGKTLQEVFQTTGRMPPYRAFRYFCHIARALDYAHGLGIVHRDLKPSNVIVDGNELDASHTKLLDFGTAKITRPLSDSKLMPTMAGVALGTPYFMAPEQFHGGDHASPQMDLYALAVMIWYLTTGEFPWGTVDLQSPLGLAELCERQLRCAPNAPPPGTLSDGWVQVLSTALSPDPADRPLSVRHLIVDLGNELPSPGGQLVKSGVEIVREICPRFVSELGPDAATVREQQHPTIVVAWPRSQEPIRPAVADMRTWTTTPGGTPSPASAAPPRTPVLTELPSTLSASNGVMAARPDRKGRGAWIAAATTMIVVMVLVTVALVARRSAEGRSMITPARAAKPADASAGPVPLALPERPTPPPDHVADPVPPSAATAAEPPRSTPPTRTTGTPAPAQAAATTKQTAPPPKQSTPAVAPTPRGASHTLKASPAPSDSDFNPNAAAGGD